MTEWARVNLSNTWFWLFSIPLQAILLRIFVPDDAQYWWRLILCIILTVALRCARQKMKRNADSRR